jgi:hypothetical protein
LNRRGIKSATGGQWHAATVIRLRERLNNPRSDEDLFWDWSPADRAPGRTSRTCLGYQDRERGSYLGKSRTGPAMTLGSPLVRFAASPLMAKRHFEPGTANENSCTCRQMNSNISSAMIAFDEVAQSERH